MTRSLAFALAVIVLASAACGKYGPPVRAAATPAAKTPPVAAPAAAADTEECADPNTPSAAAGTPP